MANSDVEDLEDILELVEEQEANGNRAAKIYLPRMDPFDKYSDRQFKNRYRFTKRGVERLLEMLANIPRPGNNAGLPISPVVQLLASLNLYATGSYQGSVAELHGLSQPSVSRILKTMSYCVARLREDVIKFPIYRAERREQMLAFYRIARFPNVIGCIDCTHIKIKNPGGPNAMLYLNRKNYFSLNVQVVSSANLKIMNIVARWRGSTHDSRIFNESLLKRKFENGQHDGILLGDSGYPCYPYLLTPVRNPQTAPEEAYNAAHIRTRNVVERLFGVWKMTFRVLYRGCNINLQTSKAMIVALAVLHNLRIQFKEEDSDDSDDEPNDDGDNGEIDENEVVPENEGRGNAFRRHFIATHFA